MNYNFRQATPDDAPAIWAILQQDIARRKADGSNQWQDGYPNLDVVKKDIECGIGYVLLDGDIITGYCAVLENDEPAYNDIQGRWLTNGDFLVVHRVAVSDAHAGKGLGKTMMECIEKLALKKNIFSIKADTNFDNIAMLRTFEKLGYIYCGKVYFRGSARMAFEKVIIKTDS